MTKIKTRWTCGQISKIRGEVEVTGFSLVSNCKENESISKATTKKDGTKIPQVTVGEFKLQASKGTDAYNFFEDGKEYIIEIFEAPKK